MSEGPLLIADALTRTVDGAVLVRDVSFQVDDGDVFTVFGPSGAGKSTLLRLLNRLDEPTSGTVYLGGMDYRQLPPQQVRRRIGLVSQQPTLINGTVANNVAWGPELRGEPIDRDAVEALLTRLGLKGFADRPADELSGGEMLPGVTWISLVAIGVGAGVVIVLMTWAGAIEATVRSLVPVGSLVIANAMKINGLALDRFTEEITSQRDEIEVGLSLGAPPQAVLARRVRNSVRASLIPVVDSLKSLGWVWIPGIMAGMILAGENPIYAALYQFVVMAMIFAAGGLTSMISCFFLSREVITDAEQLRRVG